MKIPVLAQNFNFFPWPFSVTLKKEADEKKTCEILQVNA